MDAVLSNLRNVACPSEKAGGRCTDSACIFGHQNAKSANFGGSVVKAEEPPVKRQRIHYDKEEQPEAGGPGKTPRGSAATPSSEFRDGAVKAVTAIQKPISPPPLRRKAPQPEAKVIADVKEARSRQQTAQAPGASPKSQALKSSIPASTPAARSTPARAPVVLRKPETLNPRLLKSGAPADHGFRYKALKMLHDQYARLNSGLKQDASSEEEKLVLSDQELIWRALDEEERVAREKGPIYNNVITKRIMQYKKMSVAQWKEELTAEKLKAKAAETTPKKRAETFVNGPPKVIETGLTPNEEVKMLSYLLTPIDKLRPYGYVPTVPTDAEVETARRGEELSGGWEVCDRCEVRFQVFPGRREVDGALTSGGKCVHHPGKAYWPSRAPGDNTPRGPTERRYKCCGETVGESVGCTKGETHVFKVSDYKRLASIMQFATTPPNPLAPKDRAVCFDCEMGYTVRGLELIRLTATSWPGGEELLDVLVQPLGEILDLNSRYSGVYKEDYINAIPWSAKNRESAGAKTAEAAVANGTTEGDQEPPRKRMQIVSSPVVARDLLFSLVAPETPLMGHGLENDLNSVRVVHPTVVDTILLYPHRRGLPIRNGLKMLMETELNKRIQVEDVAGKLAGHDSGEDARAAGELVRLRVQKEWARMKMDGWTLKDGTFVAPAGSTGGLLTVEILEKDVEVDEPAAS